MIRHQRLFDQYIAEMQESRQLAESWWVSLLTKEEGTVGNRTEAESRIRFRWPCGPASHPYVLATYRKYYRACDTLNRELEQEKKPEVDKQNEVDTEKGWGVEEDTKLGKEQPVPPVVFTLDWLFGKHEDLLKFLTDMVFSPIGFSPDSDDLP